METKRHTLPLIEESRTFMGIPDDELIRRFMIKGKGKSRKVNDPIPPLKAVMKVWNDPITAYYEQALKLNGVQQIAQAYLPNKSIQTNAKAHLHSPVIQFDFKGFYDSCRFDYFKEALYELDPELSRDNEKLVERLVIDPLTGGVTQGLPVSGALAGLSLIPFWVELKSRLPESIRFTQYSDDLTFSYIGREPDVFSIPKLTEIIYKALDETNLDFKLNDDKTRTQKEQYRKVTGIRINHHNQTTPSRKDYRFLRHALFILSKTDDLEKELATWGFSSKASFVGTVSYMRSIDGTGKIDRIIMKHRITCEKHNLFPTWIKKNYQNNAFA